MQLRVSHPTRLTPAWKNVSAVGVRVRPPPALWMTSVPLSVGSVPDSRSRGATLRARTYSYQHSLQQLCANEFLTTRPCRSDCQHIHDILGEISAMKGPVRRVVFNPTSIPEVRTRTFTQSTRTIPGRQAITPNPWVWNTVRNETTVIGKDASGHIETQANEAILFFDSELCNLL